MNDIEAIKQELQANTERQAALAAALLEKQMELKAGAIEQVRQIVESMGLVRADLDGLFAPVKNAAVASTKRIERAIYRDAETGKEYKGGKVPVWMKARMDAMAMTYEQYREQHLQRVN